jgi:hypothetical protein
VHIAQTLAEALKARKSARRGILVDAPVLFHSCTEAHHLAQTVDDQQLSVRVARNHHVEAVGSEVYGGEDVRDRARRRCLLRSDANDCGRTH